ncbi:MAG: dehydratase [Candidatus Aegiribacteria sp. MLS_C]|nr:MAG: dehydratase [Candidatus Aegiribacteria sp. MLS_C]
MNVLITGGAGFIGSHLADALIEKGYSVRVLDNLDPQVHGEGSGRPSYLHPSVELIAGDVRDRDSVARAMEGCQFLVHFAAAVGVGQSMYRIEHYTSVNALGASVVLEEVVSRRDSIQRMLVASSMSIYGEGLYRCGECGEFAPRLRPPEQLARHEWEVLCPRCGEAAVPIPVPETKQLYPSSIYAVNKRDHEEMFLVTGLAYGISTVALRFFNVYGTRQALSNPYTGVGAIFASRLLNGKPPVVFEDGLQSRDFIHVKDLCEACVLALERPGIDSEVLNVGTGTPTSVTGMGIAIARELGRPDDNFIIRDQFRAGDVRHCFADTSKTEEMLGFRAGIELKEGIRDLCQWVEESTALDRVEDATRELEDHGLTT